MNIDVHLDGEDGPRRFRVIRNGAGFIVSRLGSAPAEELRIDACAPGRGVYSLLIDGRSYDVHVDQDPGDDEHMTVHLLSRVISARAADARKRRVIRADSGPDGTVRITAPIPGRVVRVLAPAGTAVRRGDGIIVLEAMKMENELKAPRDGTVVSVAVEEGQGVQGGTLLATIE